MWIILFIAGILSGALYGFFPLTILITLFSLAFFWPLHTKWFPALAAGFFIFQAVYIRSEAAADRIREVYGKTVAIAGTVGPAVQHNPKSTAFILEDITVNDTRFDGKIRCTGSAGLHSNLIVPGGRIGFITVITHPPGYENPGGFDYPEYLFNEGIYGRCRILGKPAALSPAPAVQAWRGEIREFFNSRLDAEPAVLMSAMVLGEQGSPELREIFLQTGLSHILSVSGAHFGTILVIFIFIFRSFVFMFPQRLLLGMSTRILPTRLAWLLALPVVSLYFVISGMPTSAVRAFIMIAVFFIALLMEREKDLMRALGLSCFLILLFDPLAVFNISFQLSFAALFMIAVSMRFAAEPGDDTPLPRRILHYLYNMTVMTIFVTIGTAPLVIFHFNRISFLGLFTNLVFVPAIGVFILPLALVTAIASIFIPVPLFFTDLLNALATLLMKAIRLVSLPGAAWPFPSGPLIAIVLVYILFFLLWQAVFNKQGNRRYHAAAAAAAVLASLLFIFLLPPGDLLRITFLDVGEGDSILIEFPEGSTMLIDGGERRDSFDVGKMAVAPYLWDRNIRHLDYMAATHAHSDHYGGLIYIAENFPVRNFWHNGGEDDSDLFASFRESTKDIPASFVSKNREIMIDEVSLRILNPPAGAANKIRSKERDENNNAIVMLLRYNSNSILLTSDIEDDAMERIAKEEFAIETNIVKLPHHGARRSASTAFIDKFSPETAIISVGENRFGHPVAETINKFKRTADHIYRTDTDGAIIVTMTGNNYTITTAGQMKLKKIHPGLFKEEYLNFKKIFIN